MTDIPMKRKNMNINNSHIKGQAGQDSRGQQLTTIQKETSEEKPTQLTL